MSKLYFRFGTMNSGKSVEVLKVCHNYEEQGKKVMLYTSSLDTRKGQGVVYSRVGGGIQRKARLVTENIYNEVAQEKPDAVIVDEGQFLTGRDVVRLATISDYLGIPVIVYGLRTDFLGRLFEGSKALLEWADKIEEIKTVCWYCNRKAIMNLRFKNGKPTLEGESILVGDNNTADNKDQISYLPTCRRCYIEALTGAVDANKGGQKQ